MTSSPSPRRLAILLALGALYLAVCAAAFRVAPAWLPDSEIYWTLGRSLAQEGVLTRGGVGGAPELLRTPGYPLLIALAFTLAPHDPYAALAALQCLLFAATAALTALLGRWVLEDPRGAWAGVLVLVYPPLVYYLPAILMEVALTAAATLFVVAWLAYTRQPQLRTATLLGLAGAVFALVRPSFALVPVLVLAERLFRCYRAPKAEAHRPARLAAQLGLVLLIHTALLGPWLLRNIHLSEGRLPSPLGVGPGIMLLLRATQQFSPEGEGAARRDPAFIAANAALSPREVAVADASCLEKARDLIRPHRAAYLRECLYLAVYRLWTESYAGSLPPALLLPIRLMGGGLLLLAAAGAWLLRTKPGLLPLILLLGYTGAIHSVGPAVARYTLPCRPLLLILAVGFLLIALPALRHRPAPQKALAA